MPWEGHLTPNADSSSPYSMPLSLALAHDYSVHSLKSEKKYTKNSYPVSCQGNAKQRSAVGCCPRLRNAVLFCPYPEKFGLHVTRQGHMLGRKTYVGVYALPCGTISFLMGPPPMWSRGSPGHTTMYIHTSPYCTPVPSASSPDRRTCHWGTHHDPPPALPTGLSLREPASTFAPCRSS